MLQLSVDGNYQILKISLSKIGGAPSAPPSGSATDVNHVVTDSIKGYIFEVHDTSTRKYTEMIGSVYYILYCLLL